MTSYAQSCRRGRPPRGDCGLTTLEWLLITAAVAGLAALAVVLVQAYVEDTGERIANPDPRVTSASTPPSVSRPTPRPRPRTDFDLWADWESRFTQRCSLLAVLYSDVEVEVVHNNFIRADGGTTFDSVAAGYAAAADEQPPNARQGPGAVHGWAEPLSARATGSHRASHDPRAGRRYPGCSTAT